MEGAVVFLDVRLASGENAKALLTSKLLALGARSPKSAQCVRGVFIEQLLEIFKTKQGSCA